jgi:hypothetical protein
MDDIPEAVKECIRILEENVETLSNLEFYLEDEKEDEMVSDLELHQIYDMTEDIAESTKLKRAERNFMHRKAIGFQ